MQRVRGEREWEEMSKEEGEGKGKGVEEVKKVGKKEKTRLVGEGNETKEK